MTAHQPAFTLHDVGVLRSNRPILRGISWSVPRGACAAILGPNGSGKSTIARILAAHLFPSEGEVQVLGERFGSADLPTLRHRIRLVQAAGPYDVDPDLTTRDTILTGFFGTLSLYDAPTAHMLEEAERLLRQVGLLRVADAKYAVLSSGERVRALIARALASEPALLLLDEPTAGLDLLAREQVLATVESLFHRPNPTITVLLITHHVEELPPATSHVLLLDDGQVAAAGPPQAVLRSDKLSAVYRCKLEVHHRHGRYKIHVDPGAWSALLR